MSGSEIKTFKLYHFAFKFTKMLGIPQKSLIDNWSLEQAGSLLDGNNNLHTLSQKDFITRLGGLSNYINSILLYDETNYLANGFEDGWLEFEWFEKNTKLVIQPINPAGLNIDWNSAASYSDKGIGNYLMSSKQSETDLFISAERAEKIMGTGLKRFEDNLSQILHKIDESIISKKETLWFEKLKIGLDKNFKFPSLTQYVLSQATNSDDLLKVIMQLKYSGTIKTVRNKIDEIVSNTKDAAKFQSAVEGLIKENFGEPSKSDKPWSIKFPVLFVTFTRAFNLDFFKRKEHLLFLKGIIACRMEAESLNKDIERIFGRKL